MEKLNQTTIAIYFGSIVGFFSSLDWTSLTKTMMYSAVGAISSYLATKLIKFICKDEKDQISS